MDVYPTQVQISKTACWPLCHYYWEDAASCVPEPTFSLDEMSTRIDDLEKNIADLMTQAGVEEIEGTPEKAKEAKDSS